jgi:hypothetical protein
MPKRLNFTAFHRQFHDLVVARVPTWEAVGFLAPDGTVYAFGTDSKVISTVFEAIAAPIVLEIATGFGYNVESSPQTVYPDFTLTPTKAPTPVTHPCRIAIDIKTTYRSFNRNGTIKQFRYTLGSYTSFLRDPTAKKNIKYSYSEYTDHWVIGFLYTRRQGIPAKVYHRPDPSKLLCPYEDVEFFVQEKFKIVGLSPGSGNTANIGSFPTNDINDLRKGKGPFADQGKDICDGYWRHFGRKASERQYVDVPGFLAWLKNQMNARSRSKKPRPRS